MGEGDLICAIITNSRHYFVQDWRSRRSTTISLWIRLSSLVYRAFCIFHWTISNHLIRISDFLTKWQTNDSFRESYSYPNWNEDINFQIFLADNPKSSNWIAWSIFHILAILGILDGGFIHQRLPEKLCKDKLQYIRIRQLLVDHSMIKINQHISEWNCVVTEYWTIHSIYQQAAIFILNNQNLILQTFEKCTKCLTYDKEIDGFNFNKNIY